MVKELRHSASKITTYKGCSFAFFLKYIKHEIVAESVRLSFGKVVHSMLDQFYEKNFKSEESFAKSFKFHWFRYCSGDGLSKKLREHFPTKEYSMNNGRQLILSQAINFFTPNPSKTEEEILSSFKNKTRYNIHVAEKHGVTVREDNSPEAFKKYLDLLGGKSSPFLTANPTTKENQLNMRTTSISCRCITSKKPVVLYFNLLPLYY